MPDLQANNTVAGGPIFKNPSFKNVAPRAGFAWDITGDGRNALHGGAGLFFEPILSNIYRAYGNRTPPYYSLINPLNPTFPTPPISGTSSLLRLDLVDYNIRNPYRVQYNVTYQRELPARTVVTAGFVGSRGYRQIRNVEYNQAVPQIQADGSFFFPAGSTRRNPNFGSVRLRISDGSSWYKGLIAGACRRLAAREHPDVAIGDSVHPARLRSRARAAAVARRGSGARPRRRLLAESGARRRGSVLRSELLLAAGGGHLRQRAAQHDHRSGARIVGHGALQEHRGPRRTPYPAARGRLQHHQPRQFRPAAADRVQRGGPRVERRADHVDRRHGEAVAVRSEGGLLGRIGRVGRVGQIGRLGRALPAVALAGRERAGEGG